MKELEGNILEVIMKKRLIKRYMLLVISLVISAFLYNLLILPSGIVTGGVNGISTITTYFYGWDPSIVILVISVVLLLLGFLVLGVERTSGAVIATFLYPVLVEVTAPLAKMVTIDMNDLVVISIFIGIIGGFSSGLMNKTGFTNGGLPIISRILYHKYKISLSKSTLVMNAVIVLIGGIYFGYTMVMYSLIALYINSFVMEKVILGISDNKAFYIITEKHELVEKYIMDGLKHSVTIFDIKGGFKNQGHKVILTVIPTRDYFRVTEGIKEIDKKAFFLACDAYEVKGGK